MSESQRRFEVTKRTQKDRRQVHPYLKRPVGRCMSLVATLVQQTADMSRLRLQQHPRQPSVISDIYPLTVTPLYGLIIWGSNKLDSLTTATDHEAYYLLDYPQCVVRRIKSLQHQGTGEQESRGPCSSIEQGFIKRAAQGAKCVFSKLV